MSTWKMLAHGVKDEGMTWHGTAELCPNGIQVILLSASCRGGIKPGPKVDMCGSNTSTVHHRVRLPCTIARQIDL